MVAQTRFNVTFVHRLPVFLMVTESVADGHEKFLIVAFFLEGSQASSVCPGKSNMKMSVERIRLKG